MKLFRIVYKITALKLLAVSAVVVMSVYSRGNKSEHPNQKQKNYRKWWLKEVTSIIGLRLEIVGDAPDSEHSALWVANHITWLDIPVKGSAGSGFLSKAEVRKWPAWK